VSANFGDKMEKNSTSLVTTEVYISNTDTARKVASNNGLPLEAVHGKSTVTYYQLRIHLLLSMSFVYTSFATFLPCLYENCKELPHCLILITE